MGPFSLKNFALFSTVLGFAAFLTQPVLAAGAQKPCEVAISPTQLQSLMKQYVPRGSNGRAPAAAFLEVDSEGAVIREVWGLNKHQAQPVASTQKIITAYTAFRNDGLSNNVTWTSQDEFYDGQGSAAIVYSTKKNPSIGLKTRASEYLWTLMTHSSNGAALALSRGIDSGSSKAFVESMNELSYDLIGKETSNFDTYFQNPAGLTDNGDAYEFGSPNEKQRSTADNMARLTARIIGDAGFSSTMKRYGLANYPDGVVTKGGSTQAAGKTLIAFIPLPKCKSKALAYAVFGEGTSEQWQNIVRMHTQILKGLGYEVK